jgi:DNA-binding transcriptional regulator YhcF (GntR family)
VSENDEDAGRSGVNRPGPADGERAIPDPGPRPDDGDASERRVWLRAKVRQLRLTLLPGESLPTLLELAELWGIRHWPWVEGVISRQLTIVALEDDSLVSLGAAFDRETRGWFAYEPGAPRPDTPEKRVLLALRALLPTVAAGSELPSALRFGTRIGIERRYVSDAYVRLIAEGLVVRLPSGYFKAGAPPLPAALEPAVMDIRRQVDATRREHDLEMLLVVAARLGLTTHAVRRAYDWVMSNDGTVEVRYLGVGARWRKVADRPNSPARLADRLRELIQVMRRAEREASQRPLLPSQHLLAALRTLIETTPSLTELPPADMIAVAVVMRPVDVQRVLRQLATEGAIEYDGTGAPRVTRSITPALPAQVEIRRTVPRYKEAVLRVIPLVRELRGQLRAGEQVPQFDELERRWGITGWPNVDRTVGAAFRTVAEADDTFAYVPGAGWFAHEPGTPAPRTRRDVLADEIRALLPSVPPGGELPTPRQLSQRDATEGPAERAYMLLVAEGLVQIADERRFRTGAPPLPAHLAQLVAHIRARVEAAANGDPLDTVVSLADRFDLTAHLVTLAFEWVERYDATVARRRVGREARWVKVADRGPGSISVLTQRVSAMLDATRRAVSQGSEPVPPDTMLSRALRTVIEDEPSLRVLPPDLVLAQILGIRLADVREAFRDLVVIGLIRYELDGTGVIRRRPPPGPGGGGAPAPPAGPGSGGSGSSGAGPSQDAPDRTGTDPSGALGADRRGPAPGDATVAGERRPAADTAAPQQADLAVPAAAEPAPVAPGPASASAPSPADRPPASPAQSAQQVTAPTATVPVAAALVPATPGPLSTSPPATGPVSDVPAPAPVPVAAQVAAAAAPAGVVIAQTVPAVTPASSASQPASAPAPAAPASQLASALASAPAPGAASAPSAPVSSAAPASASASAPVAASAPAPAVAAVPAPSGRAADAGRAWPNVGWHGAASSSSGASGGRADAPRAESPAADGSRVDGPQAGVRVRGVSGGWPAGWSPVADQRSVPSASAAGEPRVAGSERGWPHIAADPALLRVRGGDAPATDGPALDAPAADAPAPEAPAAPPAAPEPPAAGPASPHP